MSTAQTNAERTAAYEMHRKLVHEGRARLGLEALKKSKKYRISSETFYGIINKYVPSSPVTGQDLNAAYMLARDLWVYGASLPPEEEAVLRYQLQHAARYGMLDLED